MTKKIKQVERTPNTEDVNHPPEATSRYMEWKENGSSSLNTEQSETEGKPQTSVWQELYNLQKLVKQNEEAIRYLLHHCKHFNDAIQQKEKGETPDTTGKTSK